MREERSRHARLDDVISPHSGVDLVLVTRVGEFDPRHRHRAAPLARIADLASIDRLCAGLAIDVESLAEQYCWMTPGNVDLHFLAGHTLRATVTFIAPCFLRWRHGWPSDARLADPSALTAWLTDHDVVWDPSAPPQAGHRV